eukprot:CAMPEP_0177551198 /NCGR_PEP_ID=MMETSP0369-20130122/66016_1 /TAXON_ID=447022 ORGANISM="Scrippsiella hangoei-like, Strain SHHI-4" /NCGR_SAMPLE_ID=MMETSP0369 /ASSEMBLY_ACC=CAM_ASM_000364 /LENGTH=32 /DNA_ID= /DNA_START= /DNA_END= /DNA_ORIENTATION=
MEKQRCAGSPVGVPPSKWTSGWMSLSTKPPSA